MHPAECRHEELAFASGDYYIFCRNCNAAWMRRGHGKIEYGMGANGQEIGAAPENANKGVGAQLSGVRRIAPIE